VSTTPADALTRLLAVVQSRTARWAFGLVAAALAVWAVLARRAEVADAIGRLSAGWLLIALTATVANAALAGLMWNAVLRDLGTRLPLSVAARVFFVGQLGKYVPGSVWPMVMQAELASDHGVPRRRTAAATVASLLLAIASALLVVVATLPFVPDVLPRQFGWTPLLVVPLLVLLHPRVLVPLIDRALRIVGREPLEQRTSTAGTLRGTGWAIGSWVCAGVQVAALAVPLGAPATAHTLALAAGGYALAWAVGFVVVIAPAGAGAREVALAAVLSTVLGSGPVVVVVLVSRALFTLTDLALAGLGIAVARRHPTIQ
jgi:uncharacterized membrane protein YbhN (UPF0104 family)